MSNLNKAAGALALITSAGLLVGTALGGWAVVTTMATGAAPQLAIPQLASVASYAMPAFMGPAAGMTVVELATNALLSVGAPVVMLMGVLGLGSGAAGAALTGR